MRRFKQQIPRWEVERILKTATNGVLALVDPQGNPYGVPMSFVYDEDKHIYFHCALSGRKIDCIILNRRSCFTIIDKDEVHPDKFTTFYRSVIAEGEISIIEDRAETIEALRLLSEKYSPGFDCETEIVKGLDRVLVLKMSLLNVSGKEAIELSRNRNI